MRARNAFFLVLLAAVVLGLFYAWSYFTGAVMVERQRVYMDTIVQIKVPATGATVKVTEEAISRAFREIERIEGVFSSFKYDSQISAINGLKAGELLVLPDEVFRLINKSVEYSAKTGGAFDITVKPLVEVWDYTLSAGTVPSKERLEAVLTSVGSQRLLLDPARRTISFPTDGMGVDLGGVAKGYATDRAIDVLRKNGIQNAIVNCGGDMYCLGRKSKGELWRVGIQNPRRKDRVVMELSIQDKAIVTSGDYERYTMLADMRYSHVIDPRTGWPIGDTVMSATVIADDATTADMLTTALCVLGSEGFNIIGSLKGTDAILVLKDGEGFKVEMTKGLGKRYDIAAEEKFAR
ncbi:MAG: FAD:protein FMN transferase [Candidatus Omnitrophica bacterium]|nr:FAD:protein FMN transferase [Candidatus Omnitrophota bacterium]